jgi:hypothetical protein
VVEFSLQYAFFDAVGSELKQVSFTAAVVNSLFNSFCCFRKEIRSATSSMTSVPKPLKFLRPHYGTLKSYFETMPESEVKVCVKLLITQLCRDLDWFDMVLIPPYCFAEIHG